MPDSEPLVKARKRHGCMVCQMPIEPGTRYVRKTIFPSEAPDNDTPFDYKAHSECDALWGRFGEDFDWELPPDWMDWKLTLEDAGIPNPHPWDERAWKTEGGTA